MKNSTGTKTCKTCNQTKKLEEFHLRRDGKSGTRSSCKQCMRKQHLDRYHNRGGKELQAKRSFKNNLKKYGLTEEEYNNLLSKQDNKCAICSSVQSHRTNTSYNLFVDHCHKTNRVRGLLCHHCNVGIGHFKDNKELLQKAIDYLDETNN
jgi:hypothetical protein